MEIWRVEVISTRANDLGDYVGGEKNVSGGGEFKAGLVCKTEFFSLTTTTMIKKIIL